MKRWLVALLFVGVLVGTWALLRWRLGARGPVPGVTRENFGRIKVGMTRAEVEGIFGDEPAWADNIRRPRNVACWDQGEGAAVVVFDKHNKVTEKEWVVGKPPSRLYRFVRFLWPFSIAP